MANDADFELAYCWAHARRKFIKAEGNDPIRSKQFLDMVAELYAIEAQAPPGPPGGELRRALRAERSRPIAECIKQWMIGQRFLPRSDIGRAIKYVAAHWDGPAPSRRTRRGFTVQVRSTVTGTETRGYSPGECHCSTSRRDRPQLPSGPTVSWISQRSSRRIRLRGA